MKKFVKMSLVAALAVSAIQSAGTAGDDLAQAFADGKVKGSIKSYYFAKDYKNGTSEDASIWVNGLQLGYVTGDFYGLSFGTTAQFASVTSDDDKSDKYNWSMDASGAVMSEVYLAYKFANTSMKAGRHFFWTPVVGGSGSRFIRQSFEGFSLVNKDIPNTTITAAFMSKFADRTDRDGNPGEFIDTNSRVGEDGTWTIYAKNTSIKDLTLQAQYASKSESTEGAKNGHDILYVDAKYNFGGSMKPYVAAQYLTTSYEATGAKDGDAYGVKIGANINGLSAFLAYTSVSDDNNVVQGIGSGSIPLFTNGATVDAWSATFSDTDSYKIGLGYTFGKVNLALAHSEFHRTNQKDVSETNLTATYKINKNLMAQIQYSMIDNEYAGPEVDIDSDLRTRIIYSF